MIVFKQSFEFDAIFLRNVMHGFPLLDRVRVVVGMGFVVFWFDVKNSVFLNVVARGDIVVTSLFACCASEVDDK